MYHPNKSILTRKTKIIATVGPAIKSKEMLCKVMETGANVLRLNFSHGSHKDMATNIRNIRNVCQETGYSVGIMADLKGPEVRTDQSVYHLKKGNPIGLIPISLKSNKMLKQYPYPLIGITYPRLYQYVQKRQSIFIDDGYVELKVNKIEQKIIHCQIMNSYELKEKKSLNVPNVDLELPIMNKKDQEDLDFIVKEKLDWIAISFVRRARDVKTIRSYLKQKKASIPIISKIESALAINNLEEIIESSEGIMVARGDLGVELPTEIVPVAQQSIIEKTKHRGKIVIVATQMLNSMIENPRPTRAEATDIFNACSQMVDAVLLSGETAVGKYPLETMKMMHKILVEAEKSIVSNEVQTIVHKEDIGFICKASLMLAMECQAKLLITISLWGKSARILSSYRTRVLNVVASVRKEIYHQNHLYYSVMPILVESNMFPQRQLQQIEKRLKDLQLVKKNDIIIFMFTYPSDKGSTNSIRKWVIK